MIFTHNRVMQGQFDVLIIYRNIRGFNKSMKVECLNNNYILIDNNNQVIDSVSRFLLFLKVCGKSPNTERTYCYNMKLYFEYLAIKNIRAEDVFSSLDIKPIDFLCGFMLWLQYPNAALNKYNLNGESAIRSNSTVNAIMSTVLSYYQFLSSNKEIEEITIYRYQRMSTTYKSFLYEMMHHNTIRISSILKKNTVSKPVEAISREEYNLIISNCTETRDQLLIALLFEGGLRLGEALGIHICDLNELQDDIIHIVPRENNENGARVKEFASGIIKLPEYVTALLLNYLSEIDEYSSEFLFLTLHGKNKGQPLKADTVEKKFKLISDKVGFKVTPHMLRHGFATEKLNAGWQMVDIQAYLRHKNISSTQIYATYSDELKKEIMRDFIEKNSDTMKETANGIGN